MAVLRNIINNGEEVVDYAGGSRTFAFYGIFGGGTLTISASFDSSGIFIPLRDSIGNPLEITDNLIQTIQFFGPVSLKFTLTGASNPNVAISIA